MSSSMRLASPSVYTHPSRLQATWIFFLQALPCRCDALLPRPPPRLLRHLLTLSDRPLAVLTSRSSPTTPPSCGVVPSSSRDLGDLLRPPLHLHLLRLLLQHLCSFRPGHQLPSAGSTAGVHGTTSLGWPHRQSSLPRPPAGQSLGIRLARSSLSTDSASLRLLCHRRPRHRSPSSPRLFLRSRGTTGAHSPTPSGTLPWRTSTRPSSTTTPGVSSHNHLA